MKKEENTNRIIVNIYALYDKVSGMFSQPIFQPNNTIMKRQFSALISDTSNKLAEPTDFELYHLGCYNQTTGEIEAFPKPQFIVKGEKEEALNE